MRSAPYEVQLRARSEGKARLFSFRTTEGIRSPEKILPEEVLLLQVAEVESTSAVLNVDSRIGVVGCVLGQKAINGRITMTESNARDCLVSELNRRRNEVSTGEVMLSSDLETDCIRKFDVATYIPKEEDPTHIIKQKIHDSILNLRNPGTFYTVIEKDNDSLLEFIEEYGEVSQKVKGELKALTVNITDLPRRKDLIDLKKLKHSIKGVDCKFKSLKDWFSAEQLNMVEMLAREVEADEEDKVLDAECGFGGAGIFTSKIYDSDVVFQERNAYMSKFTRENAELNGLKEPKVVTEDGLENFDPRTFDKILYQVREDKESDLVKEDFRNALKVLKPGGKIFAVHKKNKDTQAQLRRVFGSSRARRREFDFQLSIAEK